MVNIEKVFQRIESRSPDLIFLTGKTSTGKSTFSRRLCAELSYVVIELDEVVVKEVISKNDDINPGDVFVQVYRGVERKDLIHQFVSAVKSEIQKHKNKKIIIEGAIANNDILEAIFDDVLFDFLFFHPEDISLYTQMLTKRFLKGAHDGTSGLPKSFWKMINSRSLQEYKETRVLTKELEQVLSDFAHISAKESEKRFLYFQEKYPDILKVVLS